MKRRRKRAAGAICVWAGALLLTVAPAIGQAQVMRRLSADIPAEPLPQALRAPAEQTGLRMPKLFEDLSGRLKVQQSRLNLIIKEGI